MTEEKFTAQDPALGREIIVRVIRMGPSAPPDVTGWRRHDLFKKLAERGWQEDELEQIGLILDRGGTVEMGAGVSYHAVTIPDR